ncbi:methyl-accepting chemotaxis protein [Peribacillus kribbensis]|uniref:methyl-accepting chemotaxis protein n=1 Tax=Peribacillus kribbensis TaxID=356658 RepID=UPI00041B56E2|nr:methyl-accepting chemotaxis protein [Peribacillus kribbensis]
MSMKLKVGMKIRGGFFIVLLLMGCAAGLGIYEMKKINDAYSSLLKNEVRNMDLIRDLKSALYKQSGDIRGYLLTGDESHLTDYQNSSNNLEKGIILLQSQTNDPELKKKVKNLQVISRDYQLVAEKEIKAKKEGNVTVYLTLVKTSAAAVTQNFTEAADELVSFQINKVEEVSKKASSLTRQVQVIEGAALLISILFALLLSAIINSKITKPIVAASFKLKKVAEGDLTVNPLKVKSRDEIGIMATALNDMIQNLKSIVDGVNMSASQLAASSEELAASSEESTAAAEQIAQNTHRASHGMEVQSQQFETVSSSVNEMIAGLKQISHNSSEMLSAAEKASEVTEKGTNSIEGVVERMVSINTTVSQAAGTVQSLNVRSEEISNIVGLITGIADQTNLLALNAAIEAARAGEQGRGFAVVADEVRKLAVESKKSADQITSLIALVQEEIKETVKAMDEGNELINQGLADTSEANAAFVMISESIGSVAVKVKEVSESVIDLSEAGVQIEEAVMEVKEINETSTAAALESSAATEQQLATMEEVTSSAEALSKMAEDLQTSISHFKL